MHNNNINSEWDRSWRPYSACIHLSDGDIALPEFWFIPNATIARIVEQIRNNATSRKAHHFFLPNRAAVYGKRHLALLLDVSKDCMESLVGQQSEELLQATFLLRKEKCAHSVHDGLIPVLRCSKRLRPKNRLTQNNRSVDISLIFQFKYDISPSEWTALHWPTNKGRFRRCCWDWQFSLVPFCHNHRPYHHEGQHRKTILSLWFRSR